MYTKTMWFKIAKNTDAKYIGNFTTLPCLVLGRALLTGAPVVALRKAHRLCDLSSLAGVEVFCFVVPQTKGF